MSNSGDEFGDLEDDEFIQAATQLEESHGLSPRPVKRQRTAMHAWNHVRPVDSRRKVDVGLRGKENGSHNYAASGNPYRNGGTEDQLRPALSDADDCAGGTSSQETDGGEDVADDQTAAGLSQSPLKFHRDANGGYAGEEETLSGGRSLHQGNGLSASIAQELADLPSDAFASSSSSPQKPSNEPVYVASQPYASQAKATRLAAPQNGLRQTTLFGGSGASQPASQVNKRRNWPLADKNEPPTHHKLVEEELGTWVYPTNLGTIRDYQFNIVARGLFHNLLVALPTGLGKTFIAATIMLNWFRWTKSAQIVFVAPTKPLVSQQVEACFGIAGIPRSQTTMLTGGIAPGLRAEEWESKRVFFMTPQTIVNDLKTGICDPKRIVLLVVDEAHRATGGYAYVEVVKFIRRFNESFRVLALTATPGSKVEQVQEVIDGLDIARVEIRTEQSLDIRQYVQKRQNETVLFDYTEEMEMLMDLFSKALQPVLSKLNSQNAYWAKDPMALTAYGLTQARAKWSQSEAGRKAHMGVKAMVHGIFTVLASLAHSIGLLKYHGIGPFYHTLVGFRNSVDEGGNGSKYRKQINDDENFKKIMTRMRAWINEPDFIGHPKLDYLQNLILNHFVDAGEGRGTANGAPPSSTRIMVFAHFRDSAEEIVRVLKRHEPMVRPHVFVGQANSKGSAGMDQRRQLEIIQKFKTGVYNTLVATSIGEEGLDIGEIDLIVCYDSSASPIRMLQRMGRTGRKRAGKVVLLLMRGKEEKDSIQASDNYEKMQEMIAAGTRFNFHDDRSRRILPREIQPIVDKRIVEIPFENTQPDLPEPKRRGGRAPKRPPKKFHMPDGVATGFMRASRLNGDGGDGEDDDAGQPPIKPVEIEPMPSLEAVLLGKAEEQDLVRRYQHVYGDDMQTVSAPRLNAHPRRQRILGRTKFVGHSPASEAVARLHTVSDAKLDNWRRLKPDDARGMSDVELAEDALAEKPASDGNSLAESIAPSARPAPNRTKQQPRRPLPSKKRLANSPSSAAEALPSSPPATAANMRIPSQAISLGSCTTRYSSEADLQAADDAEVDSELEDFVVDDAAPIQALTSSYGLPSSSLPPASTMLGGGTGSFAGLSRSMLPDAAGDAEEELPDIVDVVSRRSTGAKDITLAKSGKRTQVVRSRDEQSESEHRTKKRRKKRRVIEESNSE